MKISAPVSCYVWLCIALGYAGTAHAQQATVSALPTRTITINPLGLLQFGPVVQGEFKIADANYLTAHFRIPYLGLLYHLTNADHDSDEVTVSPVALGLGVGYKHLFPSDKNAWYLGGVVDYSFGSSKGNDGRAWKSGFSNIAVMPNVGYRWRWPDKRKSLSLGLYAGIYAATRDEWWYVSDPANKFDERSVTGLAMIELSFGLER